MKNLKVVISGATGFIGRPLSRNLAAGGYEVVALTRNVEKARKALGEGIKAVCWDGKTAEGWQESLEGAAAVINLAGVNLAGGLWTEAYKKRILESRLNAGQAITQAIGNARQKPAVLLQASAVGYYGSRGEEILDETSAAGEGFLADLTAQWENSVKTLEQWSTRVVYLRSGIVLGRGGGMLEKMALPFKFFLGGVPGSGEQWFPWIHIDDQVNSIRFLLEHPDARGAFNLIAPDTVTIGEFGKSLARVLHRPSWLPVPAVLLKLVLRDLAEETALSSQRIIPKRLSAAGFRFLYPDLLPALDDLLNES